MDALRHLRYEGYNSFADHFARKQLDREAVYRQFASSITSTLGPNVFKLMCWGVRPELIGLFDGCRLGNDGFGYGGFSEYNSFNNIVWRNDPDHIELSQPDAYRATTLTSLTGSILMLTDPPAMYRTDRVEAARRTSPVLFARPGQIYDLQPSRSNAIQLAAIEQHLSKTQVVADRCDQTAAARRRAGGPRIIARLHPIDQLQSARVPLPIGCCKARQLAKIGRGFAS